MSLAFSPPRYFAVAEWTGTAWPPRPSAQVVRWVGAPADTAQPADFDSSLDQYAVLVSPTLPSGIVEHYIADDATYASGDGSDLVTWPSAAGTAGMTFPGNNPSIDIGDVDGTHDAVLFSRASSERCVTADFMTTSDAGEFTCAFVAKRITSAVSAWLGCDTNTNQGDFWFGEVGNVHDSTLSDGSHYNVQPKPSIPSGYNIYVLRISASDGHYKVYINGTEGASVNILSSTVIDKRSWSLGCNGPAAQYYFGGAFAEVAWWEKALSTEERADVLTVWQDKYGLA